MEIKESDRWYRSKAITVPFLLNRLAEVARVVLRAYVCSRGSYANPVQIQIFQLLTTRMDGVTNVLERISDVIVFASLR